MDALRVHFFIHILAEILTAQNMNFKSILETAIAVLVGLMLFELVGKSIVNKVNTFEA